jgi:hypothetical protein
MVEIKALAKKGNKYIVENVKFEDLTQRLLKRKDDIDVEWLFSYESPLVKPLASKNWVQWIHGVTDYDVGIINIFLDNILKAYNLLGNVTVNIEEWLASELTSNLVHELIHFLNPDWDETKVENVTVKLMVAYGSLRLPEATDVVVKISGEKTTSNSTLLLTEDNRV